MTNPTDPNSSALNPSPPVLIEILVHHSKEYSGGTPEAVLLSVKELFNKYRRFSPDRRFDWYNAEITIGHLDLVKTPHSPPKV